MRLRPLAERIPRHDKSLSHQVRRAASSVVLNLAEAAYSHAGHRRSRLESARGSASEMRAARRMTVEECLRDTKGKRLGIKLAWTRFRDPQALARFAMLLGIAVLIS